MGNAHDELDAACYCMARTSAFLDGVLDALQPPRGDLERLDLRDVVLKAIARMGPEADRSGCRVSVRARVPIRGLWDRRRVERIVTDLLGNALERGRGHPVSFTLTASSRGVQLSVHAVGVSAVARNDPLRFWIVSRLAQAMGGTATFARFAPSRERFAVELPPSAHGSRCLRT
jgi:hypothetical protein